MNIRPTARQLRDTRLYPLLKATQEQTPARRASRARRVAFYAKFVRPDSLVFDIGANVGNRVEVFLKLGARVVAVEPQAFCVRTLHQRWGRDPNLTILPIGLADEPGALTLYEASDHVLSSMSTAYVERTKYGNNVFTAGRDVRVSTLDALISVFGVPTFVKIDVEGFEHRVLAGMSQAVPLLSFEANPHMMESTAECLDRLGSMGYEFAFSRGEEMEFTSAWGGRRELEDVLRGSWGDIYARRPDTTS